MDNSKASLHLGTMWGLLVLDVSRINLPGYLENVVSKLAALAVGLSLAQQDIMLKMYLFVSEF